MNREILFKAKRKDNQEWAYGNLVYIKWCNKYYIIDFNTNIYNENKFGNIKELDIVEVIPKTVSQYINLKDINGKKIFENDIVRLKYQGEDEDTRPIKIGVINFRETQLCVNAKHLDGFTMKMYTREVVGNKFDNPELLEKEVK